MNLSKFLFNKIRYFWEISFEIKQKSILIDDGFIFNNGLCVLKKINYLCILYIISINKLAFAVGAVDDVNYPIITSIVKESIAAVTPDSMCSIYGFKTLDVGTKVVIIAQRDCKTQYTKDTVSHYEIALDGKSYFIEKSAIDLSNQEEDIVKRFSTENNNENFEKAIFISRQMKFEEINSKKKEELLVKRKETENFLEITPYMKKYGFSIVEVSIEDASKYTKGKNFYISVVNFSDKTIKYIWFSLIGFNAVKDPVIDVFRRSPSFTVKAIGPVKKKFIS
jgi:hypothetical protein